jgi:hypothetical protein
MLETPARAYLLALARSYAGEKKLAMTTVARRFHGMVTFFDDFEAGKCTVTLRKFDEMVDQFREEWPETLHWPGNKTVTRWLQGVDK